MCKPWKINNARRKDKIKHSEKKTETMIEESDSREEVKG